MTDLQPLRCDRFSFDHRKVDAWFLNRTRSSSTSPRKCVEAGNQGCHRSAVRRQGDGCEHAGPQGQAEAVSAALPAGRSDVKKAIVTLG